VGLGNNHPIVLRILGKRAWWRSSKETYKLVNFYWKMNLKDFNFAILSGGSKEHVKCLNRFERFGQIGNKDNLYRNLYFLAQVLLPHQKTEEDLSKIVPLTFSFRLSEKEFPEDLQNFAKFFRSVSENVACSRIRPVDRNSGNYFNFDFKFKPPQDGQSALRKFKNQTAESIVQDPIFFSGKNLWILKPSGLNRGKGLELFSSLDQLNEFLQLYMTGYDVKEFITMQYNDNDNISPSLVKSASQTRLDGRPASRRQQLAAVLLELRAADLHEVRGEQKQVDLSELRDSKVHGAAPALQTAQVRHQGVRLGHPRNAAAGL
jgi:hypothetical protein